MTNDVNINKRVEQTRRAATKYFQRKITEDPEFYAKDKERVKNYISNRYRNDPEYAEKLRSKQREYAKKRRENKLNKNLE